MLEASLLRFGGRGAFLNVYMSGALHILYQNAELSISLLFTPFTVT